MNREELVQLQEAAEGNIVNLYSQVEDLKQQEKNTEQELERQRGEYRAYTALIEKLDQAEAQAVQKAQEEEVAKNKPKERNAA